MIDLKTSVDALKSGSGILNPISSQASELSSKINQLINSSTPSIAAYAASLQSTLNSGSNAVNSLVSSIQTKLPLMNAVERVENSLLSSQGATGLVGPSASFTATFAPISNSASQLSSVAAGLTPTAMSNLLSGVTTNLSTLNSQASEAASSISASVASSTAGFSEGISLLKAFSFAKFISMNHAPHIQNVINSVTNSRPNPEVALLDSRAAKVMSPPTTPSYLPPSTPVVTSTEVPAPIVTQSSAAQNIQALGYTDYQHFKQVYTDYANSLSAPIQASLPSVNAGIENAAAWRKTNIPDYEAVKQTALSNPNDSAAQAAYEVNKQRYRTEGGFDNAIAAKEAYDSGRANIIRLRDQWDSWVRTNFSTAFAGPPW